MRAHKRIKGTIFSPTWLPLSVWIKFLQLPPMAFMDSVCLLSGYSRHTWEGCKEALDVEHNGTHFLSLSVLLSVIRTVIWVVNVSMHVSFFRVHTRELMHFTYGKYLFFFRCFFSSKAIEFRDVHIKSQQDCFKALYLKWITFRWHVVTRIFLDVQVDATEDEPTGFIYLSPDALSNPSKLLVLIQGSGVVRAGQWARRLIINQDLNSGTQIPFIERAMQVEVTTKNFKLFYYLLNECSGLWPVSFFFFPLILQNWESALVWWFL